MDEAERVLADCVATPDDDGPRLVWADLVGGERGELVVLQCDLARGGLAPDEVHARRRRERELLAQHGVAWAGDLAQLAARWSFRRGFVDAARVPATRARAALAAAPLADALTVEGSLDPAELDAIVGRVRGIDVDRTRDERPHDVWLRTWETLADRGALAHLRAFGLNRVLAEDLPLLQAVLAIPALEQLALPSQALEAAELATLAPGLARLRGLVLSKWDPVPLAPAMFGPALRALWLGRAGPADLGAIAASPAGAALERLAMIHGPSDDPVQAAAALRSLPALQVLQLGEYGCQALVDALLPRWPPQLRYLRTGVLTIPTCTRLARVEQLVAVTIETTDAEMHAAMCAALGDKAEPREPVLRRGALLHASADALLADVPTCPAPARARA